MRIKLNYCNLNYKFFNIYIPNQHIFVHILLGIQSLAWSTYQWCHHLVSCPVLENRGKLSLLHCRVLTGTTVTITISKDYLETLVKCL